jgi:hypothetical protein
VVRLRIKKIFLLLPLAIFVFNIAQVTAKGYETKIYKTTSGFTKGYLKLAPDGSKVGFAYFKNGKHFVQINHKVYGGFEVGKNTTPFIKFSPDGKIFAFTFIKNGQLYLQLNDQVFGDYTAVNLPLFSATGKTVCFRYSKGNRWYLWINGQRYGGYQTVESPVFTADETGFGFAFRKWGKWYVQINQQKYGRFYNYWGPFLSGDGNHWGFVGQKGREGRVYYYLGGESYGPVDWVRQFSPSADGQSFDVYYEKEGQANLRVGQNDLGSFGEVTFPQVNAGSVETYGGIIYKAKNEKYLQYGSSNFGGYQEIGPLAYGIRNKLWGFSYQKKDGYYVRISNKNYGPYPGAVVGPCFSPDERAFAFWYRAKHRIYINVNHKVYREIDAKDFAILQLVCSNNGRVTGFEYRKNGREYVRVGKMVYGGRGTIYPGSLLMSNNGVCFAYRYRDKDQEYVQMNEKVFHCDQYQSADFVITPANRACFARVKNGKIVIQEIDYN